MNKDDLEKSFAVFAAKTSKWTGNSLVFASATGLILAWGVSGPYFQFSQNWQMIVNTGTTICTFLMVFIIQNSQNRDGMALQIKLDELIRAIAPAENSIIDLEELSHQELEAMKSKFAVLAKKARSKA